MSASSTFMAQYRSYCTRCFEYIEPGDLVRYVDDELVHVRHDAARAKPEPVCDRCWLVKPCECEDLT